MLLTPEELVLITKEVDRNPGLRHPYAISVGTLHTSIYKVSPQKALIIVKGNSETGFEHIHERHDFFSFNFFSDNPSKFSTASIPIMDYSTIADAVYDQSNISSHNYDPTNFDVYEGSCHIHETTLQYRLIVYKNTRIIHTIFPLERVFNRPQVNKFKYDRKKVSADYKSNVPFLLIKIPYTDKSGTVVFRILIRKYFHELREEGFIEAYNRNDEAILVRRLGERLCNKYDANNIEIELMQWQFADLRKEERVINEISDELKSFH